MIDDDPPFSEVSRNFASLIVQKIATTRSKSQNATLFKTAIELNSHADSPVVGRGATIIERLGRTVSVSGFADRLGKAISVQVVNACYAYDDDRDGKTYLMVIRNALHIPDMEACLIPPMMMRLAGLEVDECPKFLAKQPSISNHSILFPSESLRIPLKLNGVISFVPCRALDSVELDNNDGILELAPNVRVWNPKDPDYGLQEDSMTDFRGELKEFNPKNFIISAVIARCYDPDLFCHDVIKTVISVVRSRDGGITLKPDELAGKWNISQKMVRRTIQCTTRLCPRNTESISLNRRYATNDRMIRYRHLPVDKILTKLNN